MLREEHILGLLEILKSPSHLCNIWMQSLEIALRQVLVTDVLTGAGYRSVEVFILPLQDLGGCRHLCGH